MCFGLISGYGTQETDTNVIGPSACHSIHHMRGYEALSEGLAVQLHRVPAFASARPSHLGYACTNFCSRMLQALVENLMLPVILAGDWDVANQFPLDDPNDNVAAKALDQFVRIAPVATVDAAADLLTMISGVSGNKSAFSVAGEAGGAQITVKQLLAEQAKSNTTFAAVFASAPPLLSRMHCCRGNRSLVVHVLLQT
jgi:hypothetical protein